MTLFISIVALLVSIMSLAVNIRRGSKQERLERERIMSAYVKSLDQLKHVSQELLIVLEEVEDVAGKEATNEQISSLISLRDDLKDVVSACKSYEERVRSIKDLQSYELEDLRARVDRMVESKIQGMKIIKYRIEQTKKSRSIEPNNSLNPDRPDGRPG